MKIEQETKGADSMKYIVFDLEATCWERGSKEAEGKQNEIIEIGAVMLDDTMQKIGEFNRFIQPKLNPTLSDFCKKLTTITQNDVDDADSFDNVWSDFMDWIGAGEFMLCSWGFYDKKQLKSDLTLHRYANVDWLEKQHISLKHQFAEIKNVRPCGMSKALKILDIKQEGTHHRGIDDARNITEIFIALEGKWTF